MNFRSILGPLHTWPAVLIVSLGCAGASAATRDVDQHQAADPAGTVEIINVAGSVQVSGWDKAEVAVGGTIGEKVERVELTSTGKHTTVRVVLPKGNSWGGDGAANLTVQVPRGSSIDASLVSADLKVGGVTGAQQLRTVSGDITTDGGSGARVNTISGKVQLGVADGAEANVHSISGDLTVKGAGGEVSIETVSGDGRLTLGELKNFHLETVSGDFRISARLAAAAEFNAESVSGDVEAKFSGTPGVDFELESLSGRLKDCSGHQPSGEQHGPGSHLAFTTGDGKSKVRMDSKSGNLSVCVGQND
ncbi:MAG TPA: DUF4097 family beta strand repeat-containing protein [Steroidobacteraceae bacterium]